MATLSTGLATVSGDVSALALETHGMGTAAGSDSIAIGGTAVANRAGDVALGSGATATGTSGGSALSIGMGNTAAGAGAVALGDPNVATGTGAVAVGRDNIATGTGSVALGNVSTAQGAGSIALGNDAVALNTGDVALGSGSIAGAATPTASQSLLGTNYAFAGANPTGVVSVGAPGAPRQITNLAAGAINSTSTEAVNGSELYAVDQAVTALGSKVTTLGTEVASLSSGSSVGVAATAPLVTHRLAIQRIVGSLSTSVSTAVSAAVGAPVGPAPVVTSVGQTATGLVQQAGGAAGAGAIGIGAQTGGTSVSIAGTSGDRVLSGVAAGTAADDAVDVGQLQAALGGAEASAVQYNSSSHNSVTLGGAGAAGPVALGNVAAGALTATSTSAVNGSQLYATNTNVTNLQNGAAGAFQVNQSGTVTGPSASGLESTAGGNGAVASGGASTAIGYHATASGVNSVALGANSNDGGQSNVVSVGNATTQRRITNVAPGVYGTDAVNVNQLTAVENYASALNSSLRVRVDSELASANALSSLAFATTPGKDMVSAGFGFQQGQGAFAVGLSHQFNDKYNTIVRAGATFGVGSANTGGNVSVNFQF